MCPVSGAGEVERRRGVSGQVSSDGIASYVTKRDFMSHELVFNCPICADVDG